MMTYMSNTVFNGGYEYQGARVKFDYSDCDDTKLMIRLFDDRTSSWCCNKVVPEDSSQDLYLFSGIARNTNIGFEYVNDCGHCGNLLIKGIYPICRPFRMRITEPDAEITREQLATILYRYLQGRGGDTLAPQDTATRAELAMILTRTAALTAE